MLKGNPIISICIPTRNRKDLLTKTVESIYRNAESVSNGFEVVVYDSSDIDEGIEMVQKFPYSNFTFKHGENSGYLNLIKALDLGSGRYLKLHNDYSMFQEGSLQRLLERVAVSSDESLVCFANRAVPAPVEKLTSLDSFIAHISFYSSFANIFGIWRNDFLRLREMKLNAMFPHTSLLFYQDDKQSYEIDNSVCFLNKDVPSKGGYDLFKVFAEDYLGMVKASVDKGTVREKTFQKLKRGMLVSFFSVWYSNTIILENEYSFKKGDVKRSFLVYYTWLELILMIFIAYGRSGIATIRKILPHK
jgi:abequosyltransferase